MTKPLDKLAYWPAVGFGLGLAPVAPGTFGSLLGPPLVWGMQQLPVSVWDYWSIAAVLILLGGPICAAGARVIGQKDPGAVVYDEIVSFFLVFAVVPVTWTTALLGFALFRLFDIVKPPPVRQAERFPDGWGILADDLVAGVYAGIVLAVFMRFAVPAIFPGIS